MVTLVKVVRLGVSCVRVLEHVVFVMRHWILLNQMVIVNAKLECLRVVVRAILVVQWRDVLTVIMQDVQLVNRYLDFT